MRLHISDLCHLDCPERAQPFEAWAWQELLASEIVIVIGDARAPPTFGEIGQRSEGAARGAAGLAELAGFAAEATS